MKTPQDINLKWKNVKKDGLPSRPIECIVIYEDNLYAAGFNRGKFVWTIELLSDLVAPQSTRIANIGDIEWYAEIPSKLEI